VVIVKVVLSNRLKGKFKVTCQGATFHAHLVGSLKVDMRIACWGFDTVDGIDGITHCEPVPVFICVFSFKPADEISVVKIETEKGNGETPGSTLSRPLT
jgi:hypothetical protein